MRVVYPLHTHCAVLVVTFPTVFLMITSQISWDTVPVMAAYVVLFVTTVTILHICITIKMLHHTTAIGWAEILMKEDNLHGSQEL